MKRAAVIGWPIEHSRSPLIHQHWLKVHGIEGGYEKRAVAPADLPSFLERVRAGDLAGFNVTVPHKEAVFAAADVVHPDAAAVGAANTLWVEDGQLHATNTDTFGFMAHLHETAPGWKPADGVALVLGAGGAARAIIYGLLGAGVAHVRVSNRTASRAMALAEQFGPRVVAMDWSERSARLDDVTLVVNTTSLGMAGQPALVFDLDGLPSHAVVADIVYAPLKTSLLAAAEARGLTFVDGLGMLLHQAVPGFEKWFGVRPVVTDELRSILLTDLGER